MGAMRPMICVLFLTILVAKNGAAVGGEDGPKGRACGNRLIRLAARVCQSYCGDDAPCKRATSGHHLAAMLSGGEGARWKRPVDPGAVELPMEFVPEEVKAKRAVDPNAVELPFELDDDEEESAKRKRALSPSAVELPIDILVDRAGKLGKEQKRGIVTDCCLHKCSIDQLVASLCYH